jgi:riboflavin biosynthesis pyrimidine reductase
VGQDGSTTLNGSSKALSSGADRELFHSLRQGASAILIGGNTARTEPYELTPVPLVIVSASNQIPTKIRKNPLVNIWDLSPLEAVMRIQDQFGEEILIEGGPELVFELLDGDVIDEIYLTQSLAKGGENQISIKNLTNGFNEVSRKELDGESFIHLKRER